MIKRTGVWWVPEDETHLTDYLAQHGEYQQRNRRRALEGLPRGGHCIDVGAHVGTWLVDLCDHFDHVWAIEPRGVHQQCLRRNLEERSKTNYTLISALAGDQLGHAGLCEYSGNSGHTHWQPQGLLTVLTLDSLELTSVKFIKVDVEGFEYPVLKGSEHMIKAQWPRICIEQKSHQLAEQFGGRYAARDLLISWGYQPRQHHGDDWVLTHAD